MSIYYIAYRNSHQVTHRWVPAENRKEAIELAIDIINGTLSVILVRKLSEKEKRAYYEYEWLLSNSDSSSAWSSLLERIEKSLHKHSD